MRPWFPVGYTAPAPTAPAPGADGAGSSSGAAGAGSSGTAATAGSARDSTIKPLAPGFKFEFGWTLFDLFQHMWPLPVKECVEQINRVGGQPPPVGIAPRWKTVTEREWYVFWGLVLASAQYSAVGHNLWDSEPKAGRCRLTLSKPVLKAPLVSALEAKI